MLVSLKPEPKIIVTVNQSESDGAYIPSMNWYVYGVVRMYFCNPIECSWLSLLILFNIIYTRKSLSTENVAQPVLHNNSDHQLKSRYLWTILCSLIIISRYFTYEEHNDRIDNIPTLAFTWGNVVKFIKVGCLLYCIVF